MFLYPSGRGTESPILTASRRGLRLTSPTEFSPASIAGLFVWFDLSRLSSLYQDSGLTTPVAADNDPIGGVLDLSGNGRNMVQATAGKRPLYKVNIQNGRSVALLDGTNDNWQMPSVSFPANWTVFVVGQVTGAGLRHMFNADGTPRIGQCLSSTSTTALRCIKFNTGSTPFTDTQAFTAGVHHVFEVVNTATAIQGIVDGTSDGSTGSTGTNQSGTLAPYVGSNIGGGAEFFSGYMDEIIMYSSDLDSSQRSQVRNYLKAKWATP